MEGDIVSSNNVLIRKGPILLGLEITCMFDLGEGATKQWERGEELLDGREEKTRERERPIKKKYLFLIVCEKGVLVFKHCDT